METADKIFLSAGATLVGLGVMAMVFKDTISGALMLSVGSVWLITTGVLNYLTRRGRSKLSGGKLKSGREFGLELAKKAVEEAKRAEEIKAREEYKFIETPLGEWYVRLHHIGGDEWRIVVEKAPGVGDYHYIYFKNYDDAKKFYDELAKTIKAFFREQGGAKGGH